MPPVHGLMRVPTALAGLSLIAATALVGLPAPAAAAPTLGQCWDYPAKALAKLAVPGDPVPCDGPHRAETFAVGTLPAGFPRLEDATMRQVVAVRSAACTEPGLRAYLGLPEGLPTRFRAVAVFPSNDQLAAGERWLRCDAVYDAGRDLGAMPKPAPAWVAENLANPTAFAFCTPGTGYFKMPSPTRTLAQECTDPAKQWILVARPTMGKPAQNYPGARTLDRRGNRACAKYKDVYNGGQKDRYQRGWAYTFPLAKGWSEGLRTGTCWVPLKQYLATPR